MLLFIAIKVAIKIVDKKMMAEKARKAQEQREQRRKMEEERKRRISGGKYETPTSHPVNAEEKPEIIKENETASDDPEFVRGLQLEVQLLMRLDHPNIIKLYQVLDTDDECLVVM